MSNYKFQYSFSLKFQRIFIFITCIFPFLFFPGKPSLFYQISKLSILLILKNSTFTLKKLLSINYSQMFNKSFYKKFLILLILFYLITTIQLSSTKHLLKKEKIPTHRITESSAFKFSCIIAKRFQSKKKNTIYFNKTTPKIDKILVNARLANSIDTGIRIEWSSNWTRAEISQEDFSQKKKKKKSQKKTKEQSRRRERKRDRVSIFPRVWLTSCQHVFYLPAFGGSLGSPYPPPLPPLHTRARTHLPRYSKCTDTSLSPLPTEILALPSILFSFFSSFRDPLFPFRFSLDSELFHLYIYFNHASRSPSSFPSSSSSSSSSSVNRRDSPPLTIFPFLSNPSFSPSLQPHPPSSPFLPQRVLRCPSNRSFLHERFVLVYLIGIREVRSGARGKMRQVVVRSPSSETRDVPLRPAAPFIRAGIL